MSAPHLALRLMQIAGGILLSLLFVIFIFMLGAGLFDRSEAAATRVLMVVIGLSGLLLTASAALSVLDLQ